MGSRKFLMSVLSVGIILQSVILCTAAPQNKGGKTGSLQDPSKGGGGDPDYSDISHGPVLHPLPAHTKGPSKGGHTDPTGIVHGPVHQPIPTPTHEPGNGGGHHDPTYTDIAHGPVHQPLPVSTHEPGHGGGHQDHTDIAHGPVNIPIPGPTQDPGHGGGYQDPTDITHDPVHQPITPSQGGGGHQQHPTETPHDHTHTDGPSGAKIIGASTPSTKEIPSSNNYYLYWIVGLGIAALVIIVIAITLTFIKKKNAFAPNEHTPLQDETQQQTK